ncbi:MAG: hypothetical protein D6688_04130, partial [Alphaproteobacteria bacterium]
VAAYLRWVAARQDYTVLPRGWPVPNSKGADGNDSITKPAVWSSPMPQPQLLPTTAAPAATSQQSPSAELEALRAEINALKSQLTAQAMTPPPAATSPTPGYVTSGQAWPQGPAPAAPAPMAGASVNAAQAPIAHPPATNATLQQPMAGGPSVQPLQPAATALAPAQAVSATPFVQQVPAPASPATPVATVPGGAQASTASPGQASPSADAAPATTTDPRLDRFEKAIEVLVSRLEAPAASATRDDGAEPAAEAPAAETEKAGNSAAEQLDYLVSKLGLDTETALLLLQLSGEDPASTPDTPAKAVIKEKIVDNVLSDIQTEVAPPLSVDAADMPLESQNKATIPEDEYVTLTQYFKSVFQP